MRLFLLLPGSYGGTPEAKTVQDALQGPLDAAREAWEGLLAQLDLETATWGLEAWERLLGLPTELSRPADFRRSRIRSKLRGAGTTTVAMVKNLAESFSNGSVDVIERPAVYRIDLRFVGTIGIPPNMDDLTAALEEALPAHLAYDYIIVFRTHSQLSGYTHSQLAAYTHETLRGGDLD